VVVATGVLLFEASSAWNSPRGLTAESSLTAFDEFRFTLDEEVLALSRSSLQIGSS
jgi:hypothetical protein